MFSAILRPRVQHQRMRYEDVARFGRHLDYADVDVVDHGTLFHELPYTVDLFIERAQSLNPGTSANQGLARVGRAQSVNSVLVDNILHEPMRSRHKDGAPASRRQFCQRYEEPHREEPCVRCDAGKSKCQLW